MLAHQNPKTGMFAYMIPLMSGTHRDFSSPFNDFWCCVGSGMESHAKHGESIYWHDADNLIVNLFIPSTLDWQERQAKFELATSYPLSDQIGFTVTSIAKPAEFGIALRIPYWAENPTLKVNGKLKRSSRQMVMRSSPQVENGGQDLTAPMEPDRSDGGRSE